MKNTDVLTLPMQPAPLHEILLLVLNAVELTLTMQIMCVSKMPPITGQSDYRQRVMPA